MTIVKTIQPRRATHRPIVLQRHIRLTEPFGDRLRVRCKGGEKHQCSVVGLAQAMMGTRSRQAVAPAFGPRNRGEKRMGTIRVRLALARQLVARALTASQDTASSDGWPAVLLGALPPGKPSPD